MPAADLAPLQSQQASQHTRTGEGILQVQPIETLHDRQIGLAVDHRFALSNPALVSAPSKKSFSSVSSPILACSDFTSMAGAAGAMPPEPKTPQAPPSNCAFHAVI